MRFSKLQLFAEAVQGKKIIYLYRVKEESATEDAMQLAFTTENGRTKSKDADSTATKDGSIRTPGVAEVEITATSILSKGDTLIEKLETALDNDQLLEIWEVNLEEKGTTTNSGKFKGMYFQGYLTELEKTSNAEDMVEISLTFGCNGNGKTGYVTVTEEQQEAADYVFTDTQKTGA
jgi:TP901-1 family phage major tail protein|nr:MAG TPA: major tail protein [Caudoviricetes sp.]